MAMIGGSAVANTGLAGAIKTALTGAGYSVPATSATIIDALASAIVTYVAANAEVEVTGVTSGGDTAAGTVS